MVEPELADRIAGGLYGLLVGDALGVPYEFHPPEQVPAVANIDYDPPAGFARAHRGVPPGTWSDDGAQALALLGSLLAQGRLDLDDFGARLLRWYECGDYAVDAHVFDVGISTSSALCRLRDGMPAAQSGMSGQQHNGNGSLMRVLPLALWHQGDDAALVADAMAQSLPTHAHLRSRLCCALYALWARRLLQGHGDAWPDAVRSVQQLTAAIDGAAEELEWSIRPMAPEPARGTGYVVDSLRAAVQLQALADYPAIVRAAVALGHDTDTTACIAGGIAGLRLGMSAIPRQWRDRLRGRALPDALLARLLASRGLPASLTLG